jgi:hypothetical protein
MRAACWASSFIQVMCKNATASLILKTPNQSAFAIVLSCNYSHAQVELSEMCLVTEHVPD